MAEPSEEPVVDVRELAERLRLPLVMGNFERLAPGTSFVVVVHHDPRPLFTVFQNDKPGQFTWEYLEQGPEVWRVRIGRKPA
jgi:uncharacterized protein (DUF2249 family)